MTRLVLGISLWSVIHFAPAIAADLKKKLVGQLGEYPYKGIFTLFIAISIFLIITGWKSISPEAVYTPPDWSTYVTRVLVLVAFILFLAPYPPNNIKRLLRHPQLIGMACWGIGHTLSNGESRSIVLFGGLTVWAIIEISLLNRRDGEWVKPARSKHITDFSLVLFGTLVYLAFFYTHHLIFGGSALT